MADLKKTVEVIFSAVDETGAVFSSIGSNLDSLDGKIQGIAAPFADVTAKILAFDTALLAVGVTLTTVAVSQAGQFSTSIAEIGTLFNATADQSDQLSQAILDFSRTSTSSLESINAATYIAISTGTEWADVTETLGTAEQLAAAGATDLESATALLSRTMNAYGAEASLADEYSDALFTTVQNGDTTVEALSVALGRVTSTAAAANVPIESLGAAIAALTVSGISTNEAVTYLNSLLKELLAPSKELEDALGGLDLETSSLSEVMAKLSETTGGQSAKFFELFGSSEAARAAIVLANDTSGVFTETLQAMADKAGVVSGAYEVMADQFDAVNQRLVNNLNATFVEFGLPLLDEYKDSVNALSDIFASISIGFQSEAFAPVYAVLEGAFQEISGTLESIAGNFDEAFANVDFDGLAGALGELGKVLEDVFVRVFGEIDLSTPEGLAQGIQTAVNLLETLVNVTTGIIEQFGPIFSAIGLAAQEVSGASAETEKATGNLLGSLTLIAQFGTAMGAAVILIKEYEVDIKNVFDALTGGASLLANSLQVTFDLIAIAVLGFTAGLLNTLDALPFVDFGDEAGEAMLLLEGSLENLGKNATEGGAGLDKLIGGLTGTATASSDAATGIESASSSADELTESTDATILSADELANQISDVNVAALEEAEAIDLVNDNIQETNQHFDEATAALEAQAVALGANADAFNDNLVVMEDTKTQGGYLVTTYEDLFGNIQITSEKIKEDTDAMDDNAKKTLAATKAANDFEVAMEEIASNERIQTLSLAVDLNIAQLEAETAQIEAAFDSINSVVAATSSNITGLFDTLADVDSNTRTWNEILEQIEKENEIREDELELQKELIDQQIKYFEAKVTALEKGDALIKIEATDMEPEIEAFMIKILERIQVRASEEGQEFLLGCSL